MLILTQKSGITQNQNSKKTHCRNGHEFNEANTRIRPSQKRTCKVCESERHKRTWRENLEENRAKGREIAARWRSENRERHNRNWTELRRKKKVWIDEYKRTHPCVKCGESHTACLDFHHRNPEEKELLIALAVAKASLERIQKEVEKCDILCSNCHRKLHWQERNSEARSMAS